MRTVANNSGLQQDVGFAEVAQQINNEDKSTSSEDKQAQNENIQKIKDEVRQKSEKLQAYYQKLRDKSQEGASTFSVGKVMQAGNQIATISYNGRVWKNEALIQEATDIYHIG